MIFTEPIRSQECRFELIPRSRLVNSPYQRDFSTSLTSKLLISVDIGFVVPVLVVEAEDGKYEVIDGQHRLGAADRLKASGDYEVPCIVVPLKLKERPLFFNIEKSDNIRDQATKVYNLYMHYVQTAPDTPEKSLAPSCSFVSYLISIAFAYRELQLGSPSLIEPPCKKLDSKGFLDEPVSSAISVRRTRAALIKSLEDAVTQVAEEYNIKDFQLKVAIVSQASQKLWGSRVRSVQMPFEEGIDELIRVIQLEDWSWMSNR